MRHLKLFEEHVNELETYTEKPVFKNKRFTFKTNKPTGRYKAFDSPSHFIKLDGKMVGQITNGEGYKLRFMAYKDDIKSDGNTNCQWKWIRLKHESPSLEAAQTFANQNFAIITDTYRLHLSDSE